MKQFILLFVLLLLIAGCAEKQQSPVAPIIPTLGINAFATDSTGVVPFRTTLVAITSGGVAPITIWWTHAVAEADSTGMPLSFETTIPGSYTFVAHALDAVGQLVHDTVVVTANEPPAQYCWEDSVRLSVSSTNPIKETVLKNPAGLFYVLLRITYTCDPKTGFDLISGDGVHTVYQIIDPNPKRTGTETVDLFLPVKFPFAENQRVAFTFQGGANGTYARLEKVTGCTQIPMPTAGIPYRVAQVKEQLTEGKNL